MADTTERTGEQTKGDDHYFMMSNLKEDVYGGPRDATLRFWLSIEISRQQAEMSLSTPQLAPPGSAGCDADAAVYLIMYATLGSFILRRSTSSPGNYAVSVVERDDAIRAYQVTDLGLGQVGICTGQVFANLEALLLFFYEKPFPSSDGPNHMCLTSMYGTILDPSGNVIPPPFGQDPSYESMPAPREPIYSQGNDGMPGQGVVAYSTGQDGVYGEGVYGEDQQTYGGQETYGEGPYTRGSAGEQTYGEGNYTQGTAVESAYDHGSYGQGAYGQGALDQGTYGEGTYSQGGAEGNYGHASYGGAAGEGTYGEGTYSRGTAGQEEPAYDSYSGQDQGTYGTYQ